MATVGRGSAATIVQRAHKEGTLERGTTCEQCGSGIRIEGHHDDYNKPLDLRWLCMKNVTSSGISTTVRYRWLAD